MATRWAICGAGKIANDFCLCLNSLPRNEHQILAVAATDKERAAKFASEFNIPNSFGSYEELVHVPDVDIIYVATIHPFHVETCLMYINAGKNVLCEKPMALSLEGCQKVLAAAKKKGVFLLQGFWTRFFPLSQFIKEQVVDKKVLGEVKMVEAAFSAGGKLTPDRLKKWKVGGGGLTDLGIYTIQAANVFFKGKPTVVKATATYMDPGSDKSGVILLKYPNENLASLSYSTETAAGTSSLTVRGTKGNIVIPDRFWCPTRLYLNGQLKEFPLPEVKLPPSKKFFYPNGEGFIYEIQCVRDCLLRGDKETAIMSHEDSETIMWIFQQVLNEFGMTFSKL